MGPISQALIAATVVGVFWAMAWLGRGEADAKVRAKEVAELVKAVKSTPAPGPDPHGHVIDQMKFEIYRLQERVRDLENERKGGD